MVTWSLDHDEHQSGKTFENAKIKLMAERREQIQPRRVTMLSGRAMKAAMAYDERVPPSPKSPSTNFHLIPSRGADDVA